MLQLVDIKKDYFVAGEAVHALKGVSLKFRKSEFVSILGASGCGKTTLLNIIGGLDQYTSGDLIIEGRSTKQYKDGDWDTYRNHSIGFIFQSYHLIPHQTILQNVELALMISGVPKNERRRRAIEALDKVGLKGKIHNRPNQLSGGQAQRVAIARALINDPEIVLADEPTGALDSVTSVQIMELLKEISKDRLVIMVTHNPELAEQYSTRIIRLLDGSVVGDSHPYEGEESACAEASGAENAADGEIARAEESASTAIREEKVGFSEKQTPAEEIVPKGGKKSASERGKRKKTAMSVGMAMGLSMKNLLSKRKRTVMVSVAGSIGIIGVSMVLAISAGVQGYISGMEDDLLSGFPLTVKETAIDFTALMDVASSSGTKVDVTRLKDKVYVDSLLETLMGFNSAKTTNVITQEYKEYVDAMPVSYYNALQYDYGTDMSNYIYTDFSYRAASGETTTVNASVTAIRAIYTSVLGKQPNYAEYASMISSVDSFAEIPANYEYILSQYDVLATCYGTTEKLSGAQLKDIFENKESLIMVIDGNAFSDLNFGQYGYLSQDEFINFAFKADGGEYDQSVIDRFENGTDFSFFIGEDAHSFTWYPNDAIYAKPSSTDVFTMTNTNGTVQTIPAVNPITGEEIVPYKYNPYSEGFSSQDSVDLKVKIILQKKSGISYGSLSSGLYYTEALTEHMLSTSEHSAIAEYLNATESKSLGWMPYNYSYTYPDPENKGTLIDDTATYYLLNTGSMMSAMVGVGQGDLLKVTLSTVGANRIPSAFRIYPLDFESKSLVTDYLDRWNEACDSPSGTLTYTLADGSKATVEGLTEADKINYTDTVGLIITMVNTMIQMVTIALIAFTALSLVVSTVMIGIITYVSVVERVKEIGILRAVGARKKDIKRLFNAETFIIGLAAGLFGILVTYLLSLVVNVIVLALAGFWGIAALPWWQALIMVALSVALTLISGLIPASAAAKKDPVVALRTE